VRLGWKKDEGRSKDLVLRLSSFVFRPLSSVSALNNRLGAFGKLAARHQYFVAAGKTAYPDVGTQADHAPLVATAWMWLTHTNYVVELNVSRINHT
jgi:hypothetical protein